MASTAMADASMAALSDGGTSPSSSRGGSRGGGRGGGSAAEHRRSASPPRSRSARSADHGQGSAPSSARKQPAEGSSVAAATPSRSGFAALTPFEGVVFFLISHIYVWPLAFVLLVASVIVYGGATAATVLAVAFAVYGITYATKPQLNGDRYNFR